MKIWIKIKKIYSESKNKKSTDINNSNTIIFLFLFGLFDKIVCNLGLNLTVYNKIILKLFLKFIINQKVIFFKFGVLLTYFKVFLKCF